MSDGDNAAFRLIAGSGEAANQPLRDYPPWEAVFSDGTVINAGGRDGHIPFSEVTKRTERLVVLYCHFPMKGKDVREVLTFGVALKAGPGGNPPAGSFFRSDESAWGIVGALWEFGLSSFEPLYFRRANVDYSQASVVVRKPGDELVGQPPLQEINSYYSEYLLGWQAKRANGTMAKTVLHVKPVWTNGKPSLLDDEPVGYKWEFKDRL